MNNVIAPEGLDHPEVKYETIESTLEYLERSISTLATLNARIRNEDDINSRLVSPSIVKRSCCLLEFLNETPSRIDALSKELESQIQQLGMDLFG